MKINDKLKRKIEEKQIKIHKMAKEVGIHHSEIYRILNGQRRNPGVYTVKKIADYLGVTIDELLR